MPKDTTQDDPQVVVPETGPSVCYRHPETETGLRCNRCNKLICAQCAQQSPVGFRCPDCVLDVQDRYYRNVKGYVNPYEQPLGQPFFTYVLIGVIILVWTMMELQGGSQDSDVLRAFGANYGLFILQDGQFWRFFTSMFLHIGLQHLIFNSIGLFIFGVEMEQIYGQARFVVIYILTGLFGSLASFAFKGPLQFSAGASGAIFGIIGMYLAFYLFYRQKMGEFSNLRIQRVIRILVISLIFGAFMPIDHYAHFGGLIAGFALGYGLAPRYQIDPTQKAGRGLVDFGALNRRWWVVVAGSLALVVGTSLAMTYWWSSWLWVPYIFGA